MHRREPLRHQLVASLAAARYPIRDARELARALPAGDLARAGEVRIDREALVALLCPRDFLFTSAVQLADLVATRACLALEPVPLH